MTRPRWTSQAARYCKAPPRLYSLSTAHRTLRGCRQCLVAANPGLNAGFLIRTDNVVPAAQRLAFPEAFVQIQDSPCLVSELRVTGKDPIFIAPRPDRVGVEDAPDSAGTNRSPQSLCGSSCQVGGRQSAQRQFGLADCFAGNRFDNRLVARGKNGLAPRPSCSTNEKSPHAQRRRQRRTELGCNSTTSPAATLDNAGDSWSRRANRARWCWAREIVRRRTTIRHWATKSAGNVG